MERGKNGGGGGKNKVDGSKGEGKKVKMWEGKEETWAQFQQFLTLESTFHTARRVNIWKQNVQVKAYIKKLDSSIG